MTLSLRLRRLALPASLAEFSRLPAPSAKEFSSSRLVAFSYKTVFVKASGLQRRTCLASLWLLVLLFSCQARFGSSSFQSSTTPFTSSREQRKRKKGKIKAEPQPPATPKLAKYIPRDTGKQESDAAPYYRGPKGQHNYLKGNQITAPKFKGADPLPQPRKAPRLLRGPRQHTAELPWRSKRSGQRRSHNGEPLRSMTHHGNQMPPRGQALKLHDTKVEGALNVRRRRRDGCQHQACRAGRPAAARNTAGTGENESRRWLSATRHQDGHQDG